MKKLLLCLLLTAPLCAKLDVATSKVPGDNLRKKIAQSKGTLIIKAFDADDETHQQYDAAFKNDAMTLYKLPYNMISAKETWKRRVFGQSYEDLDTVFVVYHNGHKVDSIVPKKGMNARAFKQLVRQKISAKNGLKA